MEREHVLKNKRFYLTPENLNELKDTRAFYSKLVEKFPAVVGITFYGSRMLSLNQDNKSDLDCFLFYDGSMKSKYKYKAKKYNDFSQKHEDVERTSCLQDDSPKNVEFEYVLREYFWDLVDEKDFLYEIYKVINVSDTAIIKQINILEPINFSSLETKDKKDFAFKNIPMFLFGFGARLKERRKFFLDKLSEKENGEAVWDDLREAILFLERKHKTKERIDFVDYENYPKTIEEAFTFFNC